jgi:hypothetical protein
MDVQRSGKINVVAVRSFVKSMSPGVSDAQVHPQILPHSLSWTLENLPSNQP